MFTLEHVHPMVVHFPIALILTGFVAELVYLFFRKEPFLKAAGLWLFYAGAVASAFAYASGLFLTREVYGAAGVVQSSHELYAELTVIFALVGAAFKIYLKAEGKETGLLKWIAFIFYAVTAILVSITGYYGGVLVYGYLIK